METMAGTTIDTTVLTILGAAFGVMFATLTTLLVGSIRFQHRDSTKTRQLITQVSNDNRVLIEQSDAKNRVLIEQSSEKNRVVIERAVERLTGDFNEHARVTERNHDKVVAGLSNVVVSLSDARERLARIEGHLGIGLPATKDPKSNGEPSEAA